jgi:hypothetical protein
VHVLGGIVASLASVRGSAETEASMHRRLRLGPGTSKKTTTDGASLVADGGGGAASGQQLVRVGMKQSTTSGRRRG